MKKVEMDNLKVGQVVSFKKNNQQYTVQNIAEDKISIIDKAHNESKEVSRSTFVRWYTFIKDIEVPNLLVIPTQLLLPAPVKTRKRVTSRKTKPEHQSVKYTNDDILKAVKLVLIGVKVKEASTECGVGIQTITDAFNMKYCRKALKQQVYDLCKEHDKIDKIRNLEHLN